MGLLTAQYIRHANEFTHCTSLGVKEYLLRTRDLFDTTFVNDGYPVRNFLGSEKVMRDKDCRHRELS